MKIASFISGTYRFNLKSFEIPNSRVFAFDVFFLHFQQEIWIMLVVLEFYIRSLILCHFIVPLFREDDLGASISAAQVFFDLFDRTPKIDNGSTEGQHLVSIRIY